MKGVKLHETYKYKTCGLYTGLVFCTFHIVLLELIDAIKDVLEQITTSTIAEMDKKT